MAPAWLEALSLPMPGAAATLLQHFQTKAVTGEWFVKRLTWGEGQQPATLHATVADSPSNGAAWSRMVLPGIGAQASCSRNYYSCAVSWLHKHHRLGSWHAPVRLVQPVSSAVSTPVYIGRGACGCCMVLGSQASEWSLRVYTLSSVGFCFLCKLDDMLTTAQQQALINGCWQQRPWCVR
jgi:hypothetical protein